MCLDFGTCVTTRLCNICMRFILPILFIILFGKKLKIFVYVSVIYHWSSSGLPCTSCTYHPLYLLAFFLNESYVSKLLISLIFFAVFLIIGYKKTIYRGQLCILYTAAKKSLISVWWQVYITFCNKVFDPGTFVLYIGIGFNLFYLCWANYINTIFLKILIF